MVERSIINIDYDGSGTQGKNRVCRSYGFDEDEITLPTNFYLINAFKPLLGQQNPFFGYFCAHVGLQVKYEITNDCTARREA